MKRRTEPASGIVRDVDAFLFAQQSALVGTRAEGGTCSLTIGTAYAELRRAADRSEPHCGICVATAVETNRDSLFDIARLKALGHDPGHVGPVVV